MVKEITKERLLQLGSALEAIINELVEATTPPNPKTRVNKKKQVELEMRASINNFLSKKSYKKRLS